MIKKCLYCEKEFETFGSDIVCKKFCCYSCGEKYRRRELKPYIRVALKCKECGKDFYPKYGFENKTMFCCKRCKNIYITNRLGDEYVTERIRVYKEKIKNNPELYSIHLAGKRMRSKQPNERFRAYLKAAIARDIDFDLTFEEFISFWEKKCHYCGGKIEGVGIDRLNSDSGYNINNCVPCCKCCNYMKKSMTVSDFFSHIQKIINHTAQVKPLDSSNS